VLPVWELREHERVFVGVKCCHSDRSRVSRDRGICCCTVLKGHGFSHAEQEPNFDGFFR